MIEWTFEVDSDIYEEAKKILEPMGKTVEEVCLELINHCVLPGNMEKVIDVLGLNKMEDERDEHD